MKWQMVIDTPYHTVESIEFETSEQRYINRQDQMRQLITSSLREPVEIETEMGPAFLPHDLLCESVVLFIELEA